MHRLNRKYLHPYKDYYNFEFRSPIDPWNIQEEYAGDFDKVKCLEIIIQKGQLLFIPAYWWYSIEFGENNVLCSFKYDSLMSLISTIHHHGKRFLQSQNVKKKYFPVVTEEVERNNEQQKDEEQDNEEQDKHIQENQIQENQIHETQIQENQTHSKEATVEK